MSRHIIEIDCNPFFEIVKPEIAYFLGFLWADGCIYTRKKYNYLVQITIVTSDFKYIRPTLEKISAWNYNVYKPKPAKWKEKTSAAVYSKSFVEYLLSHGFNNKENPHTILQYIPRNLHHYFWRGLFDGDGSISVTNHSHSCSISSSYNQQWKALEDICHTMGIKYFIRRRVRTKGKCSEFIITGRQSIIKFLEFIYCGFDVDNVGFRRKYDKYIELKKIYDEYFRLRTSQYRGICFCRDRNTWRVCKRINGRDKSFGGFLTEQDAYQFRQTLS